MDAPSAPAAGRHDGAGDGAPAGAIGEIERQMRHASFFMQASLEQHGQLTSKLDVYVTSLIELLLAKGLLAPDDLARAVESNREEHCAEARAKFENDGALPAWPTVMVRQDDPDSAAAEVEEVDCAARMHICKAVCCSLPFPLSADEVEAGDVRWDLGHPYVIRQTGEGYCVHNDRPTGGCEVYDKRPGVCRGYSCAHDERIWTDFDNMVLNEAYLSSRRRPDYSFHPSTADAVAVTIRPPGSRAAAPPGSRPAAGTTPAPPESRPAAGRPADTTPAGTTPGPAAAAAAGGAPGAAAAAAAPA